MNLSPFRITSQKKTRNKYIFSPPPLLLEFRIFNFKVLNLLTFDLIWSFVCLHFPLIRWQYKTIDAARKLRGWETYIVAKYGTGNASQGHSIPEMAMSINLRYLDRAVVKLIVDMGNSFSSRRNLKWQHRKKSHLPIRLLFFYKKKLSKRLVWLKVTNGNESLSVFME